MKKLFYDENNKQKETIKIGIAIDDYKLPQKDGWIAKCLDNLSKKQMEKYEFVREEIKPGVSDDTFLIFLHYKLKERK